MNEEQQPTSAPEAPEAAAAPAAENTAAPAAAAATPAAAPASASAARPFGGGARGPGGGFRGGSRGPSGGARGGQGGRGGAAGGRGGRGPGGPGGRGGRRDGQSGDVPAEADYDEKNLEVSRVTRVTQGGKRMRFRVLSVIGNRKGRAGYGLAKGLDVAAASTKAATKARKALLTVPLINETIPHMVRAKAGAAVVLLKPAPKGAGIKAGGATRAVLEIAGVPNVVSKLLGSSNKVNVVRATFAALRMLRMPISKTDDKQPKEDAPKA